mmetsp:Transcript_24543/g.62471  ORF Transcript_24543/g.62471 Transcript_24543/m.62471 type:complete len:172 (-) Transcript_24543:68-583(-)
MGGIGGIPGMEGIIPWPGPVPAPSAGIGGMPGMVGMPPPGAPGRLGMPGIAGMPPPAAIPGIVGMPASAGMVGMADGGMPGMLPAPALGDAGGRAPGMGGMPGMLGSPGTGGNPLPASDDATLERLEPGWLPVANVKPLVGNGSAGVTAEAAAVCPYLDGAATGPWAAVCP